jgi:hypothetical protein
MISCKHLGVLDNWNVGITKVSLDKEKSGYVLIKMSRGSSLIRLRLSMCDGHHVESKYYLGRDDVDSEYAYYLVKAFLSKYQNTFEITEAPLIQILLK